MNFSEKYGNDIDEAIELALKDLKVEKDEVDIEVLEEPSKGFLGLGSKLAKVRVTIKEAAKEDKATAEEIFEDAVAEFSSSADETETPAPEKRKEEKKEHSTGGKKVHSG